MIYKSCITQNKFLRNIPYFPKLTVLKVMLRIYIIDSTHVPFSTSVPKPPKRPAPLHVLDEEAFSRGPPEHKAEPTWRFMGL